MANNRYFPATGTLGHIAGLPTGQALGVDCHVLTNVQGVVNDRILCATEPAADKANGIVVFPVAAIADPVFQIERLLAALRARKRFPVMGAYQPLHSNDIGTISYEGPVCVFSKK